MSACYMCRHAHTGDCGGGCPCDGPYTKAQLIPEYPPCGQSAGPCEHGHEEH